MEDQTSQEDYQEPDWATAPNADWVLIEVKSGVEIATYSLSSKCTTFGRNEDSCSVVLMHGSISRLHARIAFDSSGWPWLKDLQSTHGVSVNKKPLPKSSISRFESTGTHPGARGVRIFPGDVIQFGASTRIYCLQGSPEFERNMNAKSPQGTGMTSTSLLVPEHQQPSKPPLDGKLSDEIIPPSYRKQWENLKALRYKIENLERESNRINAKANMQELTDGQARQLETNEGKLESLRGRADTLEEELKRFVFGQSREEQRTRDTIERSHQFEEEVFDRTNYEEASKADGSEYPQTEEGLKSLWVSQCQELHRITSTVETYSNKVTKLRSSLGVSSEEERFFLNNEISLNEDNMLRAKERLGTLETQVSDTEKLLHVINAKLEFQREKCLVLNNTITISTHQASQEKASTARRPVPQFSIATPKSIVPQKLKRKLPEIGVVVPKRLVETAVLPPSPSKRTFKSVLPTPQFIYPTATATSTTPPAQSGPIIDKVSSSAPNKHDQAHDNWQAPSDQDGSGRTKLNNRFNGRY